MPKRSMARPDQAVKQMTTRLPKRLTPGEFNQLVDQTPSFAQVLPELMAARFVLVGGFDLDEAAREAGVKAERTEMVINAILDMVRRKA